MGQPSFHGAGDFAEVDLLHQRLDWPHRRRGDRQPPQPQPQQRQRLERAPAHLAADGGIDAMRSRLAQHPADETQDRRAQPVIAFSQARMDCKDT